ncbi:Phage tail sheath protein FI [Arcticibacter svalbardensis MN12-7]|uniref:Phage tail sheath protein FI n=1 Tax=Arcticibacter svalbardensis MN12-7 TaxID=1150600 RepID=R9GS29_9SPHI|nr:phage tail sheath C-terminal domain-containing protein [Arcticibacter svalbardensis]EOR94508.1 Phage tail sheath protein FI [Arcticibacter svalbardensis MN12-7]
MADVFKTPGVYIREIPTFPPSVAEVETAIPAFIGYTEKATFNGKDLKLKPQRISSLLEYEELFGLAQKETAITITITDTTDAGTVSRNIGITKDPVTSSRFRLYYGLQMYFANGGGPCYIVSVGPYPNVTPSDANVSFNDLKDGLGEIAKVDEPTLLLFPDGPSLEASLYYSLINLSLAQCLLLQDRFTIVDVKQVLDAPNKIIASSEEFRNTATLGSNLDLMKYGAAYFPYLETTLNFRFEDKDVNIVYKTVTGGVETIETNETPGNNGNISLATLQNPPTALADLKPSIRIGLNLQRPEPAVPTSPASPPVIAPNTELYNLLKLQLQKINIVMPPSTAVAGIYAAVDSARGVWKAPANVSLSYVNAAALKISHQDQMALNVDPTSGKSINAIRYFTGKGVLIWGARTLAGNDNEWRYVPVRRFFIFAEESIKKGTEWVVFEPNDANTWVRVRAMIENFLIKQWRAGALAGAKPEHAFFVRVGLGTTMTALDILEGRMNIEIGMAVVRPAEFIILKFSHKLQES